MHKSSPARRSAISGLGLLLLLSNLSFLPTAHAAVGIQQPGMTLSHPYAHGMYLIITGSGSALVDAERGGASAAVVVDGTVLQFDLGRMALENLERAGLKPTDIDYLFFTHHHFDHIASYGYYLVSTWISGRLAPVHVFGPAGTVSMTEGAYKLHESDMRFIRSRLSGWKQEMPGKISQQSPYVVEDTDEGVVLQAEKFKVTALRTHHYAPGSGEVSLAYRVDSSYGSVVVSGDTGPFQGMVPFASGADVLVHETQAPDVGMIKKGNMAHSANVDWRAHDASGHTWPAALGEIAREAKVKMVVPYHLPPYTSIGPAVDTAALYTGPAPGFPIWGEYIASIKNHFNGSVVLAQDAMVIRVDKDSGN